MESFLNSIIAIASDSVMFWILQFSIIMLFLVAIVGKMITERNAGKEGLSVSIKRGNESMSVFYGSYAALNGLLIALCLSVEVTTVPTLIQ